MRKRPEYSLKETGNRIRKLRKERKLSVEQIRQYMQFESTQAIYKWEEGKCFPQADNLLALAELFKVCPLEIMVKEGGDLIDLVYRSMFLFQQIKRETRHHMKNSIEIESHLQNLELNFAFQYGTTKIEKHRRNCDVIKV